MGSPGSHRDNTPGTEWTSTEVLDCKMVGLRATMKKSQEGSPDRHCKGVSKAACFQAAPEAKGSPDRHHKDVSKSDVPSRGVGDMKVSGPGPRAPAIRSCASRDDWAGVYFSTGS